MESILVRKIEELEKELKELKLEKRQILLAGKSTENIDNKIKRIELEIEASRQHIILLVIIYHIYAYKKHRTINRKILFI